jgi:hypothetical protein
MKRTVIMRDRDLIAFLKKERKNPLFTEIEVEPLTYKELHHEILVDRIKDPERALPNIVETIMYNEGRLYDKRYFNWELTYDYPDGQIYVQSRIKSLRESLHRVTVTYEKNV